jgi:hypothetical protein
MGESQKCVVDELFGFQHPYTFCVKPSDKMVDSNTFNRGGWKLDNTAKVFGGIFNYVEYLVSDPNKGTSEQCLYQGKGVIGNKYVLKTNIECTPVDIFGKIIAISGETPYLHKYINNITDGSSFLTGGQSNADLTGVIPSAFYSATKIGSNIKDLGDSFLGKVKPYCMKASVKCHLVDYDSEGIRGPRNYGGNSPQVYFSIDDLKRIKPENFSAGAIIIPTISGEIVDTFDNIQPINSSINDIIIEQNMDKIQNLSELDKLLNSINSINADKMLNSINFEDELLVKIYYVGFSIFLIIIIIKLVFKKNSK